MVSQIEKKNSQCKKFSSLFAHVTLLLIVAFSVLHVANAQTPDRSSSVPPRVEIAGSQLLHLTSAITNTDYDLYINLPRGYDDTTKTFPVLFLLDAQWDFPFVQALYGQQFFDGFIPEIVIVGITWGGKDPDYDKLRARDLTPTDVSRNGTSGNAAKFHSFIAKEVIPFVEGKYRVKSNDRTLMGSSLGGLFSLYAMFQEPALFNRYVLTSPAIQWDNKMIYTLNKNFSEHHKELPAKLFMGIGGYENVAEFQKFADELKSKNYKNFLMQTKVAAGMGHSGGKADGYSNGLQSVFARADVHVDPAVLAAYVGEYEVNAQVKISLKMDQGKLVAVAPDNSKLAMKADTDVDFYLPGQFLRAHIEKDAAGKVTGFTLQQYSGNTVFKKVK